MFGIDWNMDGQIDISDDFLTLALLNEETDASNEEDDDEYKEGE